MKAVFTLIPSESRRLIAKGVAAMKEVKEAGEKGYTDIPPERDTAGTICKRVLCTTDADKRSPFPIIPFKGQRTSKSISQALNDFHLQTVIIKGANAIDPRVRWCCSNRC